MMFSIGKCSSALANGRATDGWVIYIEIGPFLIELSLTKARR